MNEQFVLLKKGMVGRRAGGEGLETRLRANSSGNASNGIVSSTTFCLSSIRLIARIYTVLRRTLRQTFAGNRLDTNRRIFENFSNVGGKRDKSWYAYFYVESSYNFENILKFRCLFAREINK